MDCKISAETQTWRRLAFSFVATIALACSLGAETITDTLRDPSGVATPGRITISWQGFIDSSSQPVPAARLVIEAPAGVFSVVLAANAGSLPAGTSYRVEYRIGQVRSNEWWIVPVSASPLTIADVAQPTAPTPSFFVNLSQLTRSLANVGDVPKWDGLAWTPDTDLTGASSGISCGTTPTPLVVVSGVITITSSACFTVDTEASGPTDDVDTIECTAGQRFELMPFHDARTVVIKQGGSVLVPADFLLNNIADYWSGYCPSTNVARERSRVSNGS